MSGVELPSEELVRRGVERWMEEAVVGLGLCPFAAPVVGTGRTRIVVSAGTSLEELVTDVLAAAVALVEAPGDQLSTTLVVLPSGVEDFDSFLAVAGTVEDSLEESGAATLVQTATFHPEYRFGGVAPDDLGNYTNRAPFPVIQLLRVEEVEEAVAGHPDPLGIPVRNIAALEELGREEVERLWTEWQGGE